MDLEIGQEIDGYKIRGVLGRGGMGVVYEAEDVALSRAVALKAINPELTQDEQFIRRFQTEARVLAKVNSPYIVGVHALRKTDLGLFIVMEFVEGGTLADRLVEGLIPLPEALKIIRQMLLAFEHAHKAGVIHRDIKPANIMLTPGGVVKVTDFGLAKQSQPDMMSTVTQGVMGTLYYMSPEQVRGMGDVDHRSDLYSLGMTIYEMLAGRLPFEKGDGEFDIMRSIVDKEFPSPKDYNPDCPAALSDIVMRVIAKKADDRYQSADEMLAAIDAYDSVPEEKIVPKPAKQTGSPDAQEPPDIPDADSPVRTSVFSRRRLIGSAAALAAIIGIVFLPDFLSTSPENGISALGALSLSTIPDEAVVFLNDRSLGETPLNGVEVPENDGNITVRIQKAGFFPIDTTLSLSLAHHLVLTATEGVDSSEDAGIQDKEGIQDTGVAPVTRQSGTVRLNIEPNGVAFLDERPTSTGTVLNVQTGTHSVLFRHPVYDEIKRQIEVVADRQTDLTCFFEGRINIRAAPVWGTVWVNGEATEFTTDRQIHLGPGSYDITVKKFGYNTELVEGPTGPIQINSSCSEQEQFEFVFKLTQ